MTLLQCYACKQSFTVAQGGDFACPSCGAVNRYTPPDGEKSPSLWEQGWRVNTVQSFIETSKRILFNPVIFFKGLKVSEDMKPGLTYAVAAQCLGFLIFAVYQILFSLFMPLVIGLITQTVDHKGLAEGAVTPFIYGIILVFMPVVVLAALFVSAALNHVFLIILRGANREFTATLQAVCYASAAQLWMCVPIFGQIIASVMQIVNLVIALREIHGISTGKALTVILLPMFICCGLIMMFILSIVMIPKMMGGHW